jgi:hypothetical protein
MKTTINICLSQRVCTDSVRHGPATVRDLCDGAGSHEQRPPTLGSTKRPPASPLSCRSGVVQASVSCRSGMAVTSSRRALEPVRYTRPTAHSRDLADDDHGAEPPHRPFTSGRAGLTRPAPARPEPSGRSELDAERRGKQQGGGGGRRASRLDVESLRETAPVLPPGGGSSAALPLSRLSPSAPDHPASAVQEPGWSATEGAHTSTRGGSTGANRTEIRRSKGEPMNTKPEKVTGVGVRSCTQRRGRPILLCCAQDPTPPTIMKALHGF